DVRRCPCATCVKSAGVSVGRPLPVYPSYTDMLRVRRHVAKGQEPSFQQVYAAGFDALKMYRLALKKYLPASLRRSNSLCHSFRSSAETSFLRATKSRISRASPLL